MKQAWLKSARLVGENVLLRPVGPQDVQSCFDLIHGCDEITDWLVWDGPQSLEDITPWYLAWPLGDPLRGCDYHFAIIDRVDGSFSGAISLRYYDHAFQGDVGYWVGREKWGRGFAGEALGILTWLAFEHTGAQLVYAECFAGNERSLRMLEARHFECDALGERLIQKGERQVRAHFLSLARSRWEELGRPGQPPEADVKLGAGPS